jgi:arsenate reductase
VELNLSFTITKNEVLPKKQLSDWCKAVEWEVLLNKRSRTWKELNEKDKSNPTQTKAITLMQQHPTLIKRPVVQKGKAITVGFDSKIFSQKYK